MSMCSLTLCPLSLLCMTVQMARVICLHRLRPTTSCRWSGKATQPIVSAQDPNNPSIHVGVGLSCGPRLPRLDILALTFQSSSFVGFFCSCSHIPPAALRCAIMLMNMLKTSAFTRSRTHTHLHTHTHRSRVYSCWTCCVHRPVVCRGPPTTLSSSPCSGQQQCVPPVSTHPFSPSTKQCGLVTFPCGMGL